jgi:predicted unusual protein kinase regulating ubiquinone biosynthesis (AarF/ABC1/UbiB family)
VLRKTGQAVAVKLLVPGIEERFRSDIKTFKRFCELAMPQHVSAFAEIEKQFLTGTKINSTC